VVAVAVAVVVVVAAVVGVAVAVVVAVVVAVAVAVEVVVGVAVEVVVVVVVEVVVAAPAAHARRFLAPALRHVPLRPPDFSSSSTASMRMPRSYRFSMS
jgi:hypothetical protein